ncbi:Cob(I)yrinic acid a,c-diamide adenosyltransferase [bioreactor metagenome]|uniref:Cob(I)yrinic acid a,c-diamide adenosyltransferase n=1 Tax=bioreactor metagenome TaxID=1076179 RepID=A0A645CQC1_9ZZZZ
MTNLGLIQVYTGNGKGKTTASLGLALRASGHNFKVCMIQFMKDSDAYGEVHASKFLPNFTLIQVGRNDFVNLADPDQIDIDLAQNGWQKAKTIITSGEYEIVILDEINVAIACKLLDVNDVVAFLATVKALPKKPELILTGRYAPQQIIDIADLVTEMQEVRHYYNGGTESRAGAEY